MGMLVLLILFSRVDAYDVLAKQEPFPYIIFLVTTALDHDCSPGTFFLTHPLKRIVRCIHFPLWTSTSNPIFFLFPRFRACHSHLHSQSSNHSPIWVHFNLVFLVLPLDRKLQTQKSPRVPSLPDTHHTHPNGFPFFFFFL